jgi:hypothetical protein
VKRTLAIVKRAGTIAQIYTAQTARLRASGKEIRHGEGNVEVGISSINC